MYIIFHNETFMLPKSQLISVCAFLCVMLFLYFIHNYSFALFCLPVRFLSFPLIFVYLL